jgi:predicted nuclease with TOPRIM domain
MTEMPMWKEKVRETVMQERNALQRAIEEREAAIAHHTAELQRLQTELQQSRRELQDLDHLVEQLDARTVQYDQEPPLAEPSAQLRPSRQPIATLTPREAVARVLREHPPLRKSAIQLFVRDDYHLDIPRDTLQTILDDMVHKGEAGRGALGLYRWLG